jgi:hypothetical protein
MMHHLIMYGVIHQTKHLCMYQVALDRCREAPTRHCHVVIRFEKFGFGQFCTARKKFKNMFFPGFLSSASR